MSAAWRQGLGLAERFGLSDSDAQILYFVASIVLTFVLVLVTAYYACQNRRAVVEMRNQNRIARDNLRLQLYDRRRALLAAVKKLELTASTQGGLTMDVVHEFARDVAAAPYLVDAADASIIDEVTKRATRIGGRSVTLNLQPSPDAAMTQRQLKDIEGLSEQVIDLKSRFEKYLTLADIGKEPD